MYVLFLFLLLALLWVNTKEPFTVHIESDGPWFPSVGNYFSGFRQNAHSFYRKGLRYIPYRHHFHKLRRQIKIFN